MIGMSRPKSLTIDLEMRSRRMIRFALPALALGVAVAGCAAAPVKSMTYDECARATRCTLHGTVTARPAEHGWIGSLALADGRCVSISLPDTEMEALRQTGPSEMTVSGRVYGDPSTDREVASMEIDGRNIGLGLCGNFFVFVPDRQ